VLGDAVAISNISAANAMPTEQNLSGEIRLAAGEFVTVRGEVAAAGNPLQLFGFAQPLTFATMSFVSP
jgi:hypothetical protein